MLKLKIFIVLLAVQVSIGAKAQSILVRVKTEARISSSIIRLGEVADVSTPDDVARHRTRDVVLGEMPQKMTVLTWSAAEIGQILRARGSELENVQFKLPQKLTMTRAKEESPSTPLLVNLGKTEVARVISESVKALLPDSSWEVRVSQVKFPVELSKIDGPLSWRLKSLVERPRGNVRFEIQIDRPGEPSKVTWVEAEVKITGQVAVATRQLAARTRVVSSDVQWMDKDLTFFNEIPATLHDLKNSNLRVMVQPGHIIARAVLERELDVRANDEIEIRAGDDTFVVTTKGKALQNGFIGDVIQFHRGSQQKPLSGTLISKGIVRVNY